MRISDWSSDVCSSDLISVGGIIGNRRTFGTGLPGVDHLRHTHDLARNAFARGFPQHGAELADDLQRLVDRSEEHTSELQSLMRISYAVFCLKKKNDRSTAAAYSKTITAARKHSRKKSKHNTEHTHALKKH